MTKSIKQVSLFYSILFGVVYAPLILFLSAQKRGMTILAPFQFFTTDTFYYLSIARHSAGALFYTSDGIYPTNGFHPLWEFILTRLFSIPYFASQLDHQILLAFGISITLTALGMMLFGLVVYHLTENFAISLLASVPGFYYLIFASLTPNYNSSWSYINGMESPLSIFWFGLLLYLIINKQLLLDSKIQSTIALAILMTLIIFSRLDDVFLLIPFLALVLLFSSSKKQALHKLVLAAGLPFIALVVYMMYNYSYTGSAMPVSGLIKNGNWLPVNLTFFITSFFPIQLVDFNRLWPEASMRSLQTGIPALLAFLWIFYGFKKLNKDSWFTNLKENYNTTIISALAVYVLIKGAYNFIFVYLMGQGHWYYPLSIMIFNLIIAVTLAGWFSKNMSQPQNTILAVAFLLLVILLGNAFINQKIQGNYNQGYYQFWQQRDTVNKDLALLDPNLKVVEYDDGVIAYLIDFPTMNGFGFTVDKEAFQAQYSGRLLEVAYQRGFRTIAVMSYITFPDNFKNDSDHIRNLLRDMPGIRLENLDLWNFKILYKDDISSAVFIQYEPVTSQ